MGKVALRVHCRHATLPRSGNRLAVMWIDHIARCENARDIGPRAVLVDKIAVCIHPELVPERGGIGRMPDRDKNAFHSQRTYLTSLNALQADCPHFSGRISFVFGNNCVPDRLDLRIL